MTLLSTTSSSPQLPNRSSVASSVATADTTPAMARRRHAKSLDTSQVAQSVSKAAGQASGDDEAELQVLLQALVGRDADPVHSPDEQSSPKAHKRHSRSRRSHRRSIELAGPFQYKKRLSAGRTESQDTEEADARLQAAAVWREYQTDEGVSYYLNTVTDLTQWERPPELDQPSRASIGGTNQRRFLSRAQIRASGSQRQSQDRGNKDLLAKIRASTGRNKNDELDPEDAKYFRTESRAAAVWQEHQTPEGLAYYYNPLTGMTQWERPAELDQPSKAEVGGVRERKSGSTERKKLSRSSRGHRRSQEHISDAEHEKDRRKNKRQSRRSTVG
eukprot:gnl/TRDRNA2_/TRDRNA2_161513_c2_seq3.p1 gnl/TRDRNA2_/TRDRNA2_161513_c2~~gnl/TRDRNA2_/TRDRNA2_161513_c2_seq3.p1  ORF type:complete len:331 (-),score=43.86 gnl/TRDRNA2_/TRDRNA2_161513_c2_seq3:183-1175(-)